MQPETLKLLRGLLANFVEELSDILKSDGRMFTCRGCGDILPKDEGYAHCSGLNDDLDEAVQQLSPNKEAADAP